jgi:hypothetical protein
MKLMSYIAGRCGVSREKLTRDGSVRSMNWFPIAVLLLSVSALAVPSWAQDVDINKKLGNEGPKGGGGGLPAPTPPPGPRTPPPSPEQILRAGGEIAGSYRPTLPRPARGVTPVPPRRLLTFEVCRPGDPVYVPPSSANPGERGIEVAYGASVPLEIREELYLKQFVTGQPRNYYLSEDEYQRFTSRFPLLYANKPEQYVLADNARRSWEKDTFRPVYFNILSLATHYSAHCSEQGEYSLVYRGLEPRAEKTLPKTEGKIAILENGINKFIESFNDDRVSKVLEKAAGADFAAGVGYVGSIYQFATMLKGWERQQWFYSPTTTDEERDAIVIPLLIHKIAVTNSKDSVRVAPQLEMYLSSKFNATYERHLELGKYLEMERKLQPPEPRAFQNESPRMNAVPTGPKP